MGIGVSEATCNCFSEGCGKAPRCRKALAAQNLQLLPGTLFKVGSALEATSPAGSEATSKRAEPPGHWEGALSPKTRPVYQLVARRPSDKASEGAGFGICSDGDSDNTEVTTLSTDACRKCGSLSGGDFDFRASLLALLAFCDLLASPLEELGQTSDRTCWRIRHVDAIQLHPILQQNVGHWKGCSHARGRILRLAVRQSNPRLHESELMYRAYSIGKIAPIC